MVMDGARWFYIDIAKSNGFTCRYRYLFIDGKYYRFRL
jgi:hypothetical protein